MTAPVHPERVAVIVHGIPIPQGSKTVVPAKGKRRAFVRDSNGDKLKPWRDKVKAHAEDATRYVETFTGPVRIWVNFTFDRPRSHYRTGRNAHLLKDDAPLYPQSKNDVDKLQRAIFDALTDAEVWTDDGLVVDVRARKYWADEHEHALPRAGVALIVEALTPSPSPAGAVSPVRTAGEAPTPAGGLF